MNEERTVSLYNAITEVREEYVTEAARPCHRVRHWGAWTAAAACLFLLIGGWSFLQPLGFFAANPFLRAGRGDGTGSNGSQAVTAYHYYAGPVLPLTAEEEGLTAEREVEYDFSLFDPGLKDDGRYTYLRSQQSCLVTDTYLLSAPEAGTYTLYYPFVTTLLDASALLPKIRVNGRAAETELFIGPGSSSFNSWEDLTALMGEDYLDRALEDLPTADRKVIVYALSGLYGLAGETAKNPTVAFEYSADMSKTAVLGWGFNGGSNDYENGRGSRLVRVPQPGEPDQIRNQVRTVYLIVLGEDVTDWRVQGYTNGGCDIPMVTAGAAVTRYESTLDEMLTAFWTGYHGDNLAGMLSPETLVGLTYRYWLEREPGPGGFLAAVRTGPLTLNELCGQVLQESRVLYLRFTAEVAPGGDCEVEVNLAKYPSRDYGGPKQARRGFDLAGKLGSRIGFTKLEAAITGAEFITILRQDFGFDPKKGLLEVALDPNGEHWYMDVAGKN